MQRSICSGIEVVITGLTRNQFASNRTRVRIPPAAPEQPAGSSGRLLFYSFAQQAIKSGHVGPPSHGLKISGARAQSARMRVKNSSCADCFYPFLLESLDLSMKSDYNKRIESEIGYGRHAYGTGSRNTGIQPALQRAGRSLKINQRDIFQHVPIIFRKPVKPDSMGVPGFSPFGDVHMSFRIPPRLDARE